MSALLKSNKELVEATTQDEWLKPIHLAAQYCDTRILKILLSYGSPIDPLDRNKATPLLRASLNGKTDCVKMLINAGANVNHVADDNIRPLHLSAMNGHYETVKLLIKNGAKVNVKDNAGYTPLDMALTKEVKELLKKYGAK